MELVSVMAGLVIGLVISKLCLPTADKSTKLIAQEWRDTAQMWKDIADVHQTNWHNDRETLIKRLNRLEEKYGN